LWSSSFDLSPIVTADFSPECKYLLKSENEVLFPCCWMADDDLLLSHRLASFPDRAVPSAPEGEKGNRPLSSEPARKRGAEAPLPVSWRPLPFPRSPPSWG